jgi:hypothetical protein
MHLVIARPSSAHANKGLKHRNCKGGSNGGEENLGRRWVPPFLPPPSSSLALVLCIVLISTHTLSADRCLTPLEVKLKDPSLVGQGRRPSPLHGGTLSLKIGLRLFWIEFEVQACVQVKSGDYKFMFMLELENPSKIRRNQAALIMLRTNKH